jgi:hypothetical protein
MLSAGIKRAVITPPVGMVMLGYIGREGVAQGSDGDLTATALVVGDGRTRLAIVGFDLVHVRDPIGNPWCTALRDRIASRLQIPRSHVLLNASHTHSGPGLPGQQEDDDPEQDRLRGAYVGRLMSEIPDLAAEAARAAVPARMGTATGEARIGINRRERDIDGSIFLGENPSGPVDHEVRVVRIDQLDGRPLAVVFAHGCHTVTMGPRSQNWSADYVGPARELVESATGCLSLFLQANAGDINPITGIGLTEDDTPAKRRLGTTLGAEVLKVHAGIYTDTVRGPRTWFPTAAKVSIYPRVPLAQESDASIDALESTLELPLQEFPRVAEAREIRDAMLARFEELEAADASAGQLKVARRYRDWAGVLLNAVESGAPPKLTIPMLAVRIGNLAIAAAPGETFSELGLRVKRSSPFADTLFLGYTNGCWCYFPVREAFPEGGWSIHARYGIPDMLFPAYCIPTALTPDAADLIIGKALDLLAGLLYRQRDPGAMRANQSLAL